MSSENQQQTKLKPGQKFPTPTAGNGDRVFYETLLQQIPTSEMAQEWCLAYGLMDDDDAKKAYKAMTKRKERERAAGSGSRSPPPAPSGEKKKRKKKKVKGRVLEEAAYDAGMDAGGDEGIGVAAL